MPRKPYDNFDDPIARAADAEELFRYRHDLFQPIWEFQSELPTRWLIQDWIPEGYLVILAAGPKQGKTSLATHLALCVATGTPFAGMPTVQSSVLWLALEENGPERRLLLNQNPLAQSSTPLYTCYEPLPIDQPETFDTLDFWLQRTEAKLIVIDPLQAASGRNLMNNWAARRSLQQLKRFCHSRRVTALVLHHAKEPPRSPARVAESDQLSATASMFIVMNHRPSSSESPPHSPVMSPDITAHEGGQGGEIAHRPLPASPSESPSLAPKSCAKQDEGGGEGLGVRSAHRPTFFSPSVPLCEIVESENSELRTPNSELPRPPSPITHDPGLRPRLISLACHGRGSFANRTIHLLSTSPCHYALADSFSLITPAKPPIPRFESEQVEQFLMEGPATLPELCAALTITPYQVRNCITKLRTLGKVQLVSAGKQSRIYASTDLTTAEAVEAYETTKLRFISGIQKAQEEESEDECKNNESSECENPANSQVQIPPEIHISFCM